MKRSGNSQDAAPTKSKDATLAQQRLEGEADELEKLLKLFAYQPVYFSQGDEETGKAKTRLEELLKARWEVFDRDLVQKGRALLEWILLCPPLVKGQPGFEWVQEEFFRLLMQRLRFWDLGQKAIRDPKGRFVGVDDQLFWEIAKHVRGKLNRGHPSSVVKDYARANRVLFFMMFENTATGQQITETEALAMVARYEVLQRVLDGKRLLIEVAGLSKGEAHRIVTSWGIDQRTGAVGFLKSFNKKLSVKGAGKQIDDWNAKQKRRRAQEFLEKKLQYSKAKAEATITHWTLDTYEGKNVGIKFLVKEHGYKELAAEKIVTRWGNTGELEGADPSPISRSLRVVKAQGLWARLGDGGLSNKEDVQKVMDLLLRQIYRKPKKGKNEFTKAEERELKRLTTNLWQK